MALASEEVLARMAERMGAGETVRWVMERGPEVVGFLGADIHRKDPVYGSRAGMELVLAPSARGRGLCRCLYAPVLTELEAEGVWSAPGSVGSTSPNPWLLRRPGSGCCTPATTGGSMVDGLERFIVAQDRGHLLTALRELEAGCKRSHWMWFIFPQLGGLGSSTTAERFALDDVDEAVDYLEHVDLRSRYLGCLVPTHRQLMSGVTPAALFGRTDALKLRSSLTLFEAAARRVDHPEAAEISRLAGEILERMKRCPRTLGEI